MRGWVNIRLSQGVNFRLSFRQKKKVTSDLQDIELHLKAKSNSAKVCSTSCEQKLRKFVKYVENHTKHYIIGFVLSVIIGLIITAWRIKVDNGALGVLIIFAGSGLTPMLHKKDGKRLG